MASIFTPLNVNRFIWYLFNFQVRNEGIGALFKGLTPVMIRAFPANAVSCFIVIATLTAARRDCVNLLKRKCVVNTYALFGVRLMCFWEKIKTCVTRFIVHCISVTVNLRKVDNRRRFSSGKLHKLKYNTDYLNCITTLAIW